MRLETASAVEPIEPLLRWDDLVPAQKLPALRKYVPGVKGHPPAGEGVPLPTLPIDAARSLTLGKKTTASNVYRSMPQHGPDKACDGQAGTRWATDSGVRQAWLEVDLGEARRIGRAHLSEAYDRVQRFALEREEGGQWIPFARGEKIGLDLELKFEPVTARKVRWIALDAIDGPTIWEFELFEP